jgi:hypothetical protein
MSFRLSSRRVCRGAAAFALVSLLACSAQAGGKERGRAIEFSEPKSDEVTTNLHQLNSKKDVVRELEEDLYTPLQSFAPKSSLEGVVVLPPRPPAESVIQSKRARELLERRKNWEFMNPEDLTAGPTVEEILKTPQYDADGRQKQDLQPLERYYQRLAIRRAGGKKPNQSKDEDLFGSSGKTTPRDQLASRDDSNLPSGVKESAEALRQGSDSDTGSSPFSQSATRSSLSDIFGLGGNTLSKEQVAEHKKLMNEYHTLVDPSWRPPAADNTPNPIFGLADAAQPVRSAAAGLAGVSSPAPHRGLDAQWDVTSPILGPAALPDVNARALGQTRPPPPAPKVEVPTVVAPTFTAPRRVF